MIALLFYSLIGGLFSLIGGIFLLFRPHITQKYLTSLIAFGAGAFLGAVFLDILPEALELVDEPRPVLLATLVGFVLFFILERIIMKYVKKHTGREGHEEHTESLPYLLILGDSLHNFMDGVVIAIAFVANPALGFPTALAIAAHEIPQEIGDFSILLQLKWKKWKIVGVNIGQSLLTIPGVLLGFTVGQALSPFVPILLGLTAGIFLYIAASDLVPELHHRSAHKYIVPIIVPFIAAIVILSWASKLAHGG